MKLVKNSFQIILIVGLLSLTVACSLIDTHKQVKLIESNSIISGVVKVDNSDLKSVYIRLYKQLDSHVELVNQESLSSDGHYYFDVLPGNYLVAAYVDKNNNNQYENGEPATYAGHDKRVFDFIDIQQNQNVELPNLTIRGPIESYYTDKLHDSLDRLTRNIGEVVNLDDPRFETENVSLGQWRPLDFAENVDGGLLLLQNYDKEKTPVIFVHGALGSPQDFRAIIKNLDLDKFQPWVLYYPSGARLDMVSDYFLSALNQLYNNYGFADVQIISHSMGGLMSRSLLMKQYKNPNFKISLFVTINSPLYGMDSAASGVKHSPIVIPAWRDVASNSDYVKRVHEWRLPAEIPYYLIFSYLKGQDGDGVVSMSSQLSPTLQDEAIKIYGFNAQHAEILQSPELINRINLLMADPGM